MGWEERINDSLQQVHSKPCSQMTGMRGLVSMAATTWVTPAGPKPWAVAVSVQKRKKLRRSMPWDSSTSKVEGWRSDLPITPPGVRNSCYRTSGEVARLVGGQAVQGPKDLWIFYAVICTRSGADCGILRHRRVKRRRRSSRTGAGLPNATYFHFEQAVLIVGQDSNPAADVHVGPFPLGYG